MGEQHRSLGSDGQVAVGKGSWDATLGGGRRKSNTRQWQQEKQHSAVAGGWRLARTDVGRSAASLGDCVKGVGAVSLVGET